MWALFDRSVYLLILLIWNVSASSQGLKLFSPEVKDVAPKTQVVVMNFLERYFQELSTLRQTSVETKMADDKVYFRKGKSSDLSHICDSIPFSINLIDRYYEVNWMKWGKPFVTIAFPAQYDLLLGQKKDEALRTFKNAILAAPQRTEIVETPSELTQVNKYLYRSNCDTLEQTSLTDALYYSKVREEIKPIFDGDFMDYSAANLFHGLINNVDYRMYVEQSVYGMSTVNYSITLNQWLNYCAEWGLKVYFTIEKMQEDGLLALIIAQSNELGYHHLLSVVIPDKFIHDQNSVLKVRMTPYIPIHNVINLFQEESSTHKKVKWQ